MREEAYKTGLPWVSDGDLPRLVTTAAKRTPDRAWLAGVSAVVLQQSVADLHRGYRNYFAALADVKAGRAKGNQQTNGRLRLPKAGDLRVRWSRDLPSPPSSVTITLDGAGRYHASFVVQVQEAPLPRRHCAEPSDR